MTMVAVSAMPRADMLREKASAVGSMWGSGGGVVGEVFDVEEDGAGDVVGEVAGVGVDGRGDAYGGEGGVEDDGVGVVEASGEPCGGDERIHGIRLLCVGHECGGAR